MFFTLPGVLFAPVLGVLADRFGRKKNLVPSLLLLGIHKYFISGGALASVVWYYPFALSIIAVPAGILVLTLLDSSDPKNQQDFKQYLSSAFKNIKIIQVLGLFSLTVFTFIIYAIALLFIPFVHTIWLFLVHAFFFSACL